METVLGVLTHLVDVMKAGVGSRRSGSGCPADLRMPSDQFLELFLAVDVDEVEQLALLVAWQSLYDAQDGGQVQGQAVADGTEVHLPWCHSLATIG